jgi:hypothetical protein
MNDLLKRFPRQLGHWTLHGIFNALPSFIIVIFVMNVKRPETAIPAMLLAITCYIFAFSVITSLEGPLSDKNHLLSRALRLGTRIRTVLACISLPFLAVKEQALLFVPDMWCGWAAVLAYEHLRKFTGAGDSLNLVERGEFLPIFVITLIEGFIISFLIVMISFFCVIILQSRARRQMIAASRIGKS